MLSCPSAMSVSSRALTLLAVTPLRSPQPTIDPVAHALAGRLVWISPALPRARRAT